MGDDLVKRFDLTIDVHDEASRHPEIVDARMDESPDGAFVTFEDHWKAIEALQSERDLTHAAAIEAAVGAALRAISVKGSGYRDENERLLSRVEREMKLELAKALRTLHTDASLAYLAEREERIKREALIEAAETAKKKAREYEQTYDNTTEIGTAVHAAITALIEKDKDDD